MTPSRHTRAAVYVEALEEVSMPLLALLDGCSSREWQSVAAIAGQLALDLADTRELIVAMAAGAVLPAPPPHHLAGAGDEDARRQDVPDAEETINLLRSSLFAMEQVIAGMGDEQLTALIAGQPAGLQSLVETGVLGRLQASLAMVQDNIQHVSRTSGGIGSI